MSVRVWVPKGCITVKWVFWDYELLRSIKAKVFANDAETYEPLTFLPTIFNKRGTCILASSFQAAANSQTSTAQTLLEPQKPECNMRYLCLASNSKLLMSSMFSCTLTELVTSTDGIHILKFRCIANQGPFRRPSILSRGPGTNSTVCPAAATVHKWRSELVMETAQFKRMTTFKISSKEQENCFIGLTRISKCVAFLAWQFWGW